MRQPPLQKIHPAAAQGFEAGAATYVAGRPDYPASMQSWLVQELGLGRGKAVLDLGAGTGKFTSSLLSTGSLITAVEPVDAMRAELVRQYPVVIARSGSAEHIPADDACMDAVVCAQSFHWFATEAALREIHRVLKPGGWLGLVWNVRDSRIAWVQKLNHIMKPFEGDIPRFHSQKWRLLFPAEGFSALKEQRFANLHTGPPEQVIVDRIVSVSFISALPPREQAQVRAQLRAVIAQSPEIAGRAEVTFPYETMAFACQKLT